MKRKHERDERRRKGTKERRNERRERKIWKKIEGRNWQE